MPYSVEALSDDCYEGTTCLINKFNIKDASKLKELEAINYIHPFREGNGRTQRVFITQLIRYNDYDINFSKIDTDYLMFATIQSAQGVTDHLKKIFIENITT